MARTLRLAVDPCLICLPNPCHSVDQIEGFVESLLGWSELLRREDIQVLVADTVRLALIEDNEYPYPFRLRNILHQFQWPVADHETVCTLAQSLLDRTPSLEDSLGVRDVLYDEDSCRVTPEQFTARLNGSTRNAFVEMLVIMSVSNQLATVDSGTTVLASPALEDDSHAEENLTEIAIESEVQDVECLDANWCSPVELPALLTEKFSVADCYMEFLQRLGIWNVWNSGDENAAEAAIELCISDLIASGVASARAHYQVGGQFMESASRWGCFSRTDYAAVIVESCARIVLGRPKNPLKEFRESASSSRQIVRPDGARAFRTHLTKRGVGLRLMFWVLPDGTIEFANIGDKDELVIQ